MTAHQQKLCQMGLKKHVHFDWAACNVSQMRHCRRLCWQELDHRPRSPHHSIPAQGSRDCFVGAVFCWILCKRCGCCWYAFHGAPSVVLPTAWMDPSAGGGAAVPNATRKVPSYAQLAHEWVQGCPTAGSAPAASPAACGAPGTGPGSALSLCVSWGHWVMLVRLPWHAGGAVCA